MLINYFDLMRIILIYYNKTWKYLSGCPLSVIVNKNQRENRADNGNGIDVFRKKKIMGEEKTV